MGHECFLSSSQYIHDSWCFSRRIFFLTKRRKKSRRVIKKPIEVLRRNRERIAAPAPEEGSFFATRSGMREEKMVRRCFSEWHQEKDFLPSVSVEATWRGSVKKKKEELLYMPSFFLSLTSVEGKLVTTSRRVQIQVWFFSGKLLNSRSHDVSHSFPSSRLSFNEPLLSSYVIFSSSVHGFFPGLQLFSCIIISPSSSTLSSKKSIAIRFQVFVKSTVFCNRTTQCIMFI